MLDLFSRFSKTRRERDRGISSGCRVELGKKEKGDGEVEVEVDGRA